MTRITGRVGTTAGLLLGLLGAGCPTTEVVGSLPPDASPVLQRYAGECESGDGSGCYALGVAFSIGEETHQGIRREPDRAQRLFRRACTLGLKRGCEAAEGRGAAGIVPQTGEGEVTR